MLKHEWISWHIDVYDDDDDDEDEDDDVVKQTKIISKHNNLQDYNEDDSINITKIELNQTHTYTHRELIYTNII